MIDLTDPEDRRWLLVTVTCNQYLAAIMTKDPARIRVAYLVWAAVAFGAGSQPRTPSLD